MSSKKDIEKITDKAQLQDIMEQNSKREGAASFSGKDIEEESRMNELYQAALDQLNKLNRGEETSSRRKSSDKGSNTLESFTESVTRSLKRAFASPDEIAEMDTQEKMAKEQKEKDAAAKKAQEEQEKVKQKELAIQKQKESEQQEQEILAEQDPVNRINLAVKYGKDRIISAEFRQEDGVTLKAYLNYIEQNPQLLTDKARYSLVRRVVYNNIEWYWHNNKLPQASSDAIARTIGRLQYLSGNSKEKETSIATLLSVKDQTTLQPIDHVILAEHFAAEKGNKESAVAYVSELAMLDHLYQAAVSQNGTDPAVIEARLKLRQYLKIDVDSQVKEEKNNTFPQDLELAYQKKRNVLRLKHGKWKEAETAYEKAKEKYAKDSKLAEEKYENSKDSYQEERDIYKKNAIKYNKAYDGIVKKVHSGRSIFESQILQTIKSIDDFIAEKKFSSADKQVPEDINNLSLDELLT